MLDLSLLYFFHFPVWQSNFGTMFEHNPAVFIHGIPIIFCYFNIYDVHHGSSNELHIFFRLWLVVEILMF